MIINPRIFLGTVFPDISRQPHIPPVFCILHCNRISWVLFQMAPAHWIVVQRPQRPQSPIPGGLAKFTPGPFRLSIPHAMHSPLMAPILPELRKAAETCELLEEICCRCGVLRIGNFIATCQQMSGDFRWSFPWRDRNRHEIRDGWVTLGYSTQRHWVKKNHWLKKCATKS